MGDWKVLDNQKKCPAPVFKYFSLALGYSSALSFSVPALQQLHLWVWPDQMTDPQTESRATATPSGTHEKKQIISDQTEPTAHYLGHAKQKTRFVAFVVIALICRHIHIQLKCLHMCNVIGYCDLKWIERLKPYLNKNKTFTWNTSRCARKRMSIKQNCEKEK